MREIESIFHDSHRQFKTFHNFRFSSRNLYGIRKEEKAMETVVICNFLYRWEVKREMVSNNRELRFE